MLQSDGTYVTSSFIYLTASRWDHGQVIRCEASNEVLEQLELAPQEADMVLNVRYDDDDYNDSDDMMSGSPPSSAPSHWTLSWATHQMR